MLNNNKTSRIHPAVLVASVALTLVSLLGIAAMTGILPESRGDEVGFPVALAAAEPVVRPKAVAKRPAEPQYRMAVYRGAAECKDCGTIMSISAVAQPAPQGSGVGAVAGALIGGALGNQVGGGDGRKLATVAGAIGGGYAGNAIEKRAMTVTHYVVSVRMDSGGSRSFTLARAGEWRNGDQVRVVDGAIRAMS